MQSSFYLSVGMRRSRLPSKFSSFRGCGSLFSSVYSPFAHDRGNIQSKEEPRKTHLLQAGHSAGMLNQSTTAVKSLVPPSIICLLVRKLLDLCHQSDIRQAMDREGLIILEKQPSTKTLFQQLKQSSECGRRPHTCLQKLIEQVHGGFHHPEVDALSQSFLVHSFKLRCESHGHQALKAQRTSSAHAQTFSLLKHEPSTFSSSPTTLL